MLALTVLKILVSCEVVITSIILNVLSRTFLTKEGAVDNLRKGTIL